ncbi:MAG: hypothetical protein ABSG76_06035 [Xanthobacteraceae bacterium]
MPTIRSALTLLIAVGLPAWAQTLIGPATEKCFASSSATYRFADRPGTTVLVAGDLADPDLTISPTDSPETADFILIDDPDGGGHEACAGSSLPTRTIRLSDDRLRPDVKVALARMRPGPTAGSNAQTAADVEPRPMLQTGFTIYVRSTAFTIEEAAALFAVMARDSAAHAAAR